LAGSSDISDGGLMKYAALALAAACLFLTSGCRAEKPLAGGSHPPVTLSSWVVSWDRERGMEEYEKTADLWDGISLFAADFDEKGNLHFPENLENLRPKGNVPVYLTVVNDRALPGGKMVEKDREMVAEKLKTEESRYHHVKDIIRLAKEKQVDGIEVDYEKIGQDRELMNHFCDFTRMLDLEARAAHLKVRIILEPSTPMSLPYSEGPEYVVMMYNLYGTHSGPGPKADRDFIEKMLKKMVHLPGKKAAAFSTGGCLWQDSHLLGLLGGKKKYITESEAIRLAETHHAVPERDPESAALHVSYKENGSSFDVWYGDRETMNAWITLAANEGISSVSLWRLGGVDMNGLRKD